MRITLRKIENIIAKTERHIARLKKLPKSPNTDGELLRYYLKIDDAYGTRRRLFLANSKAPSITNANWKEDGF